jgi:Family of unknown function (DUF5681)
MPFKPGQSGNPKGRAQGSQNKVTRALKEAILIAAERAGFKLKPEVAETEGGLVGYLEVVAVQEVGAFCSLLGKVLPMTLADSGEKDDKSFKITTEVVWPADKDGNIVYPSWWEGEKKVIPASSLSIPVAGGSRREQLKDSEESANLIKD